MKMHTLLLIALGSAILASCTNSISDTGCNRQLNYSEDFDVSLTSHGTWSGIRTVKVWSNRTYMASETSTFTNFTKKEWTGVLNEAEMQTLRSSFYDSHPECLPASCITPEIADTEGYNLTVISQSHNFSIYQYACLDPKAYTGLPEFIFSLVEGKRDAS
jgi:hypothetical protein